MKKELIIYNQKSGGGEAAKIAMATSAQNSRPIDAIDFNYILRHGRRLLSNYDVLILFTGDTSANYIGLQSGLAQVVPLPVGTEHIISKSLNLIPQKDVRLVDHCQQVIYEAIEGKLEDVSVTHGAMSTDHSTSPFVQTAGVGVSGGILHTLERARRNGAGKQTKIIVGGLAVPWHLAQSPAIEIQRADGIRHRVAGADILKQPFPYYSNNIHLAQITGTHFDPRADYLILTGEGVDLNKKAELLRLSLLLALDFGMSRLGLAPCTGAMHSYPLQPGENIVFHVDAEKNRGSRWQIDSYPFASWERETEIIATSPWGNKTIFLKRPAA